MNCIDDRIMKQIYLEVDKATKNLFNDEQMAQIIANLVENKVRRHILDRAHQMLTDKIDIILDDELNNVIKANDIAGQVRYEAKRYLRSSEFQHRLEIYIEHLDLNNFADGVTLKELKEFLYGEYS